MSSQSLKRHIGKLEAAFGERCLWCEQAYWTDAATTKAIGPYSETVFGNEAGLVVVREVSALLEQGQGNNGHLEHLPRFDLDIAHPGVIEAWRHVVESRPPRSGCPCFAAWELIRDIEAKVVTHYPHVADRLSENLAKYAASPHKKPLRHFIGGCACLESRR